MHKSDIKILKTLLTEGYTDELKSCSILQLLEKVGYSYSKMHNDITKLASGEYVAIGLKNSRANTYYITGKGIDKLSGYNML